VVTPTHGCEATSLKCASTHEVRDGGPDDQADQHRDGATKNVTNPATKTAP
jgi:hypothetical protein